MEKVKTIQINYNTCTCCRLCVEVCPATIFTKSNNRTVIDENKLQYCIGCGDCLCVCPTESIHCSSLRQGEALPEQQMLDPKGFISLLAKRRSIRSYQSGQLSEDEKGYLSRAASLVPRGGHTESIRNTGFIFVENTNLIKEITQYTFDYMRLLKKKLSSVVFVIPQIFNKELKQNINSTISRIDSLLQAQEDQINMVTYNAPALVILHGEKGNHISRDNAIIMAYQLVLAAEALDLGTCFLGWVNFALQSFRMKKPDELNRIFKKLGIPRGREVMSVLAIGKKKGKYRRIKIR